MKELCMHYFIGTMAKRLQSAALFNPNRVFSSCFSFSPGLCAHYLSRNRINFHKSHREPLHLSPELTLQLPVCHANIYHCNSNLDGMLTHSNQRSRKFNIVTFYQLSYFSSPPSSTSKNVSCTSGYLKLAFSTNLYHRMLTQLCVETISLALSFNVSYRYWRVLQ